MKFRRQKSFVAAILCASMIMPNCAWAGEVDQANHAVVQETQDTSEEKIFEESSDATESTETIENTETADAAETEADTEETEVVPETQDDANEPQTEQTERPEETSDQTETDKTDDLISEDQEQKEGLVKEDDGKIYYYENGEKFTDGYKEVTDENGNTAYYYFQEDGSAFTSGLKSVVINGERYGYYFQNNGQAYVNGLLEWKDDDGKVYYYYFQKNGRMYVGGYKGINTRAAADNSGNVTPIDDHTTHYYYLQQNGQAYTGGFLEFVHTNGKTYYYYFQSNGQAYTGGYKGINSRAYTDGKNEVKKISDSKTYYYYFQNNGQAFRNGLLEFVHTNGKTYYYYFQDNGQAYTGGYKGINARYSADAKNSVKKINDTKTYYYYFQNNGQAFRNGLLEFVHTNGKTYYYYFQDNGQAYTKGYKGVNTRYSTDGKSAVKKIDDSNKYYYYFQINGQAYTGGFLKFVHTNDKTYYYYFQSNGQAYTGGYKGVNVRAYTDGKSMARKVSDKTGYYYYFQSNGQAYTKGYLKFKHTNNKTYIFYFQSNGQAYTGGWLISGGKKYYFDSKGHGYTGLQKLDGERYYFNKSTGVLEWTGRRYQNPSGYYQIQESSIKLSGGDYELNIGYEGLRVAWVIRALGLGNAVGMNGAYYSQNVKNAVIQFQKKHGLTANGITGLKTWRALGYTDSQWYKLGAYASPLQVDIYSSRADCIEAMISRAYDYLGDDYVIGASGAPGYGVDCSGLVMQALFAAGIDMSPINPVRHAHPGYEYESQNIWTSSKLKHVSYGDRERGDIIIYCNSSGTVIHSAIYLGNNQVIESWPNKVQVSSLKDSRHPYVKGVLRVFN